MLLDIKLIAVHLGCALCLITKIILSPMVKLADYVQAKVERKKLETVK